MSELVGGNGLAVAEGLVKHFKSGPVIVKAVDGVSFQLPRSAVVALRGPSGCGKSTLLNLIGALDRPDSGRLTVDGVDVAKLSGRSEAAYRRRKVGFDRILYHEAEGPRQQQGQRKLHDAAPDGTQANAPIGPRIPHESPKSGMHDDRISQGLRVQRCMDLKPASPHRSPRFVARRWRRPV